MRIVATSRLHTQGTIENTYNPLDVAIEGSGFLYGSAGGRDGRLHARRRAQDDAQGRIVTAEGQPLDPPINIPGEATSVTIGADGTVSATVKNQQAAVQLGQIQIATFVNPAGLMATGHNMLLATGSSGDPQVGNPGSEGRGTLLQGAVEPHLLRMSAHLCQRGFDQ